MCVHARVCRHTHTHTHTHTFGFVHVSARPPKTLGIFSMIRTTKESLFVLIGLLLHLRMGLIDKKTIYVISRLAISVPGVQRSGG